VGVDVDEAGRDEAAGGVDDAAGGARHLADRGDDAVAHGDVGHPARRSGPVDHERVTQVQIVHADPPSVSARL
jgi:hypothetical protein